MTPSVRHAAFAAHLITAGCSAKPAARVPDAGTPGTAGSAPGAAGTGGAGVPDAAAGTGGSTFIGVM